MYWYNFPLHLPPCLLLWRARVPITDITSGGIQPHQPYDGYKSFLDTSTAHLRTYVASGSVASGSSSQFGGVHHAQQQTPGQTSQSKWEEPYFDDTTPRNVTGLVGKSAYLSCRVKNLGNKTVRCNSLSTQHALCVPPLRCIPFIKHMLYGFCTTPKNQIHMQCYHINAAYEKALLYPRSQPRKSRKGHVDSKD